MFFGKIHKEPKYVRMFLMSNPWQATDTITVIVVAFLIAISGFIAMAETSLTRITRVKAAAMVDQGRRGAKVLAKLIAHPTAFLNAILLTGLVSQLVAATLVGVVAERLFGTLGITVAIVFETIVIFILAEALPKNMAVRHTEKAALFSAPIVAGLVKFPLVRLSSWIIGALTNLFLKGKPYAKVNAVSEEELLAMADAAAEEDVIEDEEREFIASVIEFGDTVARELMVPRLDIVATNGTLSVEEVLTVALDKGFSRVPIYDTDIDHITGLVLAKDLMRASRSNKGHLPASQFSRKAYFVPETKQVPNLLREMQAGKYHLVVVVDEYGGTAGVVSMEDLIEELLGEITDEFDSDETEVVEIDANNYLIKATKSVDELNEELGFELPTGDWDTLSGLYLQLLGHLPEVGEVASTEQYELVAETVLGNRVVRLRLKVLEASDNVTESRE